MATSSPSVPPMPDASVPVVMPDGRMNPDWYRWLKAVLDILNTIRSEIP
jgi:hypothetical protein